MRPYLATVLAPAAALVLLVGCGSTVEPEDGGGGAGSTSGGGTGGQALLCPEYADADATQPVGIRIRNHSGLTLYARTLCGALDERSVTPVDASPDLDFEDLYPCAPTCGSVQGPQDACGDCASGAIRIDPEVSLEDIWPGIASSTTTMPAACWHSGAGGSCRQEVLAPAGDYSIEVIVYDSCPDCVCDDDGDCTGEPGGLTGYAYGYFTHPTLEQVEVFLEPCVFGCAER